MSLSRRRFGALAGCALANLASPRRSFCIRPRPNLLILIVAEQFRADYLDRGDRRLGNAGFRRLMEDGAYFPDCRHLSTTFTSTGMATVATGCYPELHGIVADRWYNRSTRQAETASTEALEATTLAAQLAEAGHTRVFGVGLEEHPVALFGRRAQLFHMDNNGRFVTRGDAPAWLSEFNRQLPVENLREAKWAAIGAGPNVPPLRVLRWNEARPEEFVRAFKASPFAEQQQFSLVRELISRERLGHADTFDVVILGLGSAALLGYETGGTSPLMTQFTLQLDRSLEFLIEGLNKSHGDGKYTLVFTGAHGAPPAPGSGDTRNAIVSEELARAVNQALSDRYDVSVKNRYVEKYVYPFLYLNLEQLRRYDIDLRRARLSAGEVAMRQRGVAGFYTADGDSSHRGDWLYRFRNSFHAVRSGDLMLSYLPDVVEAFPGGRGVSYGSLYNYDARVPLILYGPQFRAAAFERTVEAIDIAPTLARACGIDMPSSATGRVLAEALKE